MPAPIISKETLVPISLIVVVIGAAAWVGGIKTEVATLQREVTILRNQMVDANQKLDTLLGRQNITAR
ncbi:MAG: hypothetical protein Q8Q08_12870 [Candidatus Omnitrophota bacterium]|nr:hypothetical protein [Candidatus Omnitrophota bacterium]